MKKILLIALCTLSIAMHGTKKAENETCESGDTCTCKSSVLYTASCDFKTNTCKCSKIDNVANINNY